MKTEKVARFGKSMLAVLLVMLGLVSVVQAAQGRAVVVTTMPAAKMDKGSLHVVKKGEIFWRIAFYYKLNPRVLFAANRSVLKHGAAKLAIGQILFIPGGHLTAKGETWQSMAKQFHVSVKRLQRANPEVQNIKGGMLIKVPMYEDASYRKKALQRWQKHGQRQAGIRKSVQKGDKELTWSMVQISSVRKKPEQIGSWKKSKQFIFRNQTDCAIDRLGIASDREVKAQLIDAIFQGQHENDTQTYNGEKLILLDGRGKLHVVRVDLPEKERKTTLLRRYRVPDKQHNCELVLVRASTGQIGLVANECASKLNKQVLIDKNCFK